MRRTSIPTISEFSSLSAYENESTAGLARRGWRNGLPGLPVRWRSANLGRFRHRLGWPLRVAPARILWHRTVASKFHCAKLSFCRPRGTFRCRSAQPYVRADSHRRTGVCGSTCTLGLSSSHGRVPTPCNRSPSGAALVALVLQSRNVKHSLIDWAVCLGAPGRQPIRQATGSSKSPRMVEPSVGYCASSKGTAS